MIASNYKFPFVKHSKKLNSAVFNKNIFKNNNNKYLF